MNATNTTKEIEGLELVDGIISLCSIAHFYSITADPAHICRELAIESEKVSANDIIRAAHLIDMKARLLNQLSHKRLMSIPLPALIRLQDNKYYVVTDRSEEGVLRLFNVIERKPLDIKIDDVLDSDCEVILIQRTLFGKGKNPKGFSLAWFMPTIKRYKKPLVHVMVASFFIQIFALITPLFFQVIIDKVMIHKSYETLMVLSFGLLFIGIFDVILRYLRTWVLSHTANRIDVELGRRLFHHLFSLPMQYFESRSAGTTVARIRELENIRSFFTGQALFSVLDFFFVIIFIAVLFLYSWFLALITILSIPIYFLISFFLHPFIKKSIDSKFYANAATQQFLVETVVAAQTVKASAVEPAFRKQWEERLASYVRRSFDAIQITSFGQNSILLTNKIFSVLILFFGTTSVIKGDLTMGEFIAFNMISAQVVQPILRMSQLWQEFQQVQVSVERLGDVISQAPEFISASQGGFPDLKGNIKFDNTSFSYRLDAPPVLTNINLEIKAGEVIGIVGASGSGKSTLTKLVQRLYLPSDGKIIIDDIDIHHADPAWLRRNIGVVLQENILFNRSIHDNIAFANPSMSRAAVMQVARLAGADEFIATLTHGYDTILEERGSNLSGGQRQRIAIARALATNPPVLILDEATSALDYESENVIRENMKYMVKGRTVIIIAHRLSTVRQCDRILGMKAGKIVEQGTHEELLKANGVYAHLWSLQNDIAPMKSDLGEKS